MKKTFFFILLIFSSCNKKVDYKNYQKKIIEENLDLKRELKYEYYSDSVIKEVSEIENGRKHGRIIQFSSEGLIKRKIFINYKGEMVGDETLFDSLGRISEHLFRLNSDTILFYSKFKENEKLSFFEGRPYYLHGYAEVNAGDTLSFYIAAPLIPKHKTYVSFYETNISDFRVDYVNDIRQFKYHVVVPFDIKKLEFNLKVEIKDSSNNTIISDFNNELDVIIK
uniref:hypothetical protein n=2 Tax=Flavobacterium sp. TaxID=239 RepID=UPI0040492C03